MNTAISNLLKRVNIKDIISQDFELRDYGSGRYSKGIIHDSLVVDNESQIFYWNSLGITGTALDWFTIIKGMPIVEAVDKLKIYAIRGLNTFHFKEISPPLGGSPTIYPKLMDIFHELGKNYREYWYDRGYSDKTIDKFKLGFTGKCYTIPIIYDSLLYNFQCRTPDKRIWSWVSGIGTLPFNFDTLTGANSVIITESPTNAIMLDQFGYKAVSQTGGANNWSKSWNKFLTSLQYITIIYDNDQAGFYGALRLGKLFKDRARIFLWPDQFPEHFDANDFFKIARAGEFGDRLREFNKLLADCSFPYELIKTPRFLEWELQKYKELS